MSTFSTMPEKPILTLLVSSIQGTTSLFTYNTIIRTKLTFSLKTYINITSFIKFSRVTVFILSQIFSFYTELFPVYTTTYIP